MPNDKKIQQRFKIDLDWFQDNFKETYYDSKKKKKEKGCYYEKDKQNSNVIHIFETYLLNKQHPSNLKPNMQWLYDIYQQINIEKIISKLKNYISDQ